MNLSRPLFFILIAFTLCSNSSAQINKGADYFGTASSSSLWLNLSSDGKTLTFIALTGTPESGTATVASDNTGSFTMTQTGRAVLFKINPDTITGSYGNAAFSANKESSVGPQSGVSGIYSGSVQDHNRVNTDTFFGNIVIYPSGRALIAMNNSTGGILGSGTRDANGRIVLTASYSSLNVTLSNAATFSFNFAGGSGQLVDSVQVVGITRPTDFYYDVTLRQNAPIINIATRGLVAPNQQMIGGFVIKDRPKTVLIRVVGPRLKDLGVAGANSDPFLTLYAGQTVIASNDNWNDNANASDIVTASAQAGAFGLTVSSKDAVLLVNLLPGAYTAQASAVGSASGDALIEVYEITK